MQGLLSLLQNLSLTVLNRSLHPSVKPTGQPHMQALQALQASMQHHKLHEHMPCRAADHDCTGMHIHPSKVLGPVNSDLVLACCRETSAAASKSNNMPPALAFNGAVLQPEHVLPAPRPAFGQVQDTALQHDATANSDNRHSQPHGLHTSSSYDQTGSVNSTDHFSFPTSSRLMDHISLGNTSEISPPGRHSLSDGIPPAFETSSSCGASAAALSPIPGRHFATPHLATGKLPCSGNSSQRKHTLLYLSLLCLPFGTSFLEETCCCCLLCMETWSCKRELA